MKFINLSSHWEIVDNPILALKCELIFGHYKRDTVTIPIVGGVPIITGRYLEEWSKYTPGHDINPKSWLPDHQFLVVKDSEGHYFIVEGEDTSNRCLLLCGAEGGFRGDIKLHETTGIVIGDCYAFNACSSRREVAVILYPNGYVTFLATGRRLREYRQLLWDGAETIHKKIYTSEEYNFFRSGVTKEGLDIV